MEVFSCSDLKEFELKRFELWCCCSQGSLSLIPIYTKFPLHKGAFKWACSEGIFQGKERAEQLLLPFLHLPWNKPLTVFLQGEMPDVALVRGAGENLRLLDLLKPFCTALLCPKNLNNYFFFSFFFFLFLDLLFYCSYWGPDFLFFPHCWKDKTSPRAGRSRWKLCWHALQMSLQYK